MASVDAVAAERDQLLYVVPVKEVDDEVRKLFEVGLKSEVASIEEMDFSLRQILLESLGTFRAEDKVVLAPRSEDWHLAGTEPLLELGVPVKVGPVIVEEIQLDRVVPGAVHTPLIEGVSLRSDVSDPIGRRALSVLVLGGLRLQEVTDGVTIFEIAGSPVLLDWVPKRPEGFDKASLRPVGAP